jgi:hypothetical protein
MEVKTILMILIIIATLICAIYSYNCVSFEKFSNSSPYTNTALMGFNEMSSPCKYKRVDFKLTKPISNFRELNSMKMETRHPGLVKQRYTYNDAGGHIPNNNVYDFAYLKDLPLDLNIYLS